VLAFAVAVTLSVVASVSADDNVREVQEKLRDGGFYTGEIDGAYSPQLSTALTRYQIRNGLPITGQLDVDTSKALGAKPAVNDKPCRFRAGLGHVAAVAQR
jgi:peptidoglycan hydrolase-like protein with peptidoglycan-binding domain